MNYDFSKCNNLRWKCEDTGFGKHSGFCRVFKDSKTGEEVISFIEICNSPFGCRREYYFTTTTTDKVDEEIGIRNLQIIPRDPNTYDDWQVGDKVKILDDELETVVEVGARINNIVICFNSRGVLGTYTCEELFNIGRLMLTDYEKSLTDDSLCPFKRGDKVLVRDKGLVWTHGTFKAYNKDWTAKYLIAEDDCAFDECIPYNEHTWQLLGTTDKYKEDEK